MRDSPEAEAEGGWEAENLVGTGLIGGGFRGTRELF